MYHYRYHALTITGIFLALGIGLFLGVVLAPQWMLQQQVNVLLHLENRYHNLQQQNNQLLEQTSQLRKNSKLITQELQMIGTHYISNRLLGKHLAIMNVSQIDTTDIIRRLKEAGAEISWNIQINQLGTVLHNALNEEQLEQLGWKDQKEQADKLIHTLVTSVMTGDLPQLQKIEKIGMLNVIQHTGNHPEYLIVVGGTDGIDKNLNKLRKQEFDRNLISTFQQNQLSVVVVERTDSREVYSHSISDLGVSTIDNVDHVAGQIALIDILNGAHGHFGLRSEAEALFPEPKITREVFRQ